MIHTCYLNQSLPWWIFEGSSIAVTPSKLRSCWFFMFRKWSKKSVPAVSETKLQKL